ncbi:MULTISPECIES: SDR family oxidoreductase [Fischerella]|uniref:NAD(P)-dependent oxidoreductase n=1 Tax=Fischerella muscicola CCMEE 5323 TaxID=2019572 RepID=A0A2N6K8I9_FISMU|nr:MULTISPECIES: NAD-dependent epimerase/dehydratase family protein [Fischerella]MBD2433122.1 SDR family oxidoreductase [Fischerella sp. FACHB-380]PLZ93915.1 NAD(P)-dependent oxidoreductase [Fischerella muscicola CCMEE 5323]
MNITIIGCGYVGLRVAQYWQQECNFIVTATTTTPERVAELETIAQRVIVLQGNDFEKLKSVLKNQDVVLLSVGAKGPNTYEESYLQTARNLISALKQTPSVQQLIYTSSCSVYGEQNGALVDEETQVAPTTPGSEILYATEQELLSGSSDNLRVCILRLGGIYGPNRELVKIYSRIAGTTSPGNGEEPANWIHVDDIVAAIEFARRHRLQGIYNLVDNDELTTREVSDRVCEIHNLPKVTWDSSLSSKRPYNAKISNKKIKEAGYEFIHPQMIFC